MAAIKIELSNSDSDVINDSSGRNIDPVAEKALLRKCDLHVLPPLFGLFLLSFIDRTNIGNAKIQGLEKDLHMQGSDYNVALFAFFVPYILLEVPSNLMLKKLSPSTWLSSIMVLWGLATLGMGLICTFEGLVAMRVLLGVFESGLLPGCVYLISMYYKRYELQWRFTLFFTASIIGGAIGGLLAFAISKMDGIAGYNGWRWIFIVEGLLTVIYGAMAYFWVTDWPETSSFLTADERALLIARLSADTGEAAMNRLDKHATKRIFRDLKVYLSILMYFGCANNAYAAFFFIPSIIKEMGFTSAAAQVHTIPIFVAATIIAIITAWLTDRAKHRYAFCMLGLVVASIGLIILLNQQNLSVGVKYFALFLVVCGSYITQPITLVWISNLMSGHYKRSIASSMQVGFGNIGGITASTVFLSSQAPRYPLGYGFNLGMLWVCGAACTVLFLLVKVENGKRDKGKRDYRLEKVDKDNLGDDHPRFRYTT